MTLLCDLTSVCGVALLLDLCRANCRFFWLKLAGAAIVAVALFAVRLDF